VIRMRGEHRAQLARCLREAAATAPCDTESAWQQEASRTQDRVRVANPRGPLRQMGTRRRQKWHPD